jgi:hypothetical protein
MVNILFIVMMAEYGILKHANEITLKPEFNWFLTTEFRELRDNYKPQKYTESEKHDNSAEDVSNNVINGDNGCSNSNQSKQEKGNSTCIDDNTINKYNDLSHTPEICDVPTGDKETLRTGKIIIRCFTGSDWWRCTAEKCRMKGDIYTMRSHIC